MSNGKAQRRLSVHFLLDSGRLGMALLCILFLMDMVICMAAALTYLPLPPPILCNSSGCTVDNYQGIWLDRKPCKASQALYPTSEAELFAAVALASKTRTQVRVVGKGSHSISKLVCPAGDHGLLISTQFYNSLIHVNLSSLTVTAHAGVMLRTLLDEIAHFNLTLPHTPFWQGVSVAGMISTGAHGSSMWGKGSAPHDYVVGMRLILPATEAEGYAKIVDLNEEDEDLNAARLSLGVLGAISQVTFQLEPMFKRSVKLEIRGDESLEDDIFEFARKHEFGSLCWYPGSGKVLYKIDDRVAVETQGEGSNKMPFLEKMEVDVIESFIAGLDSMEETQDKDAICQASDMSMEFRQSSGDGLINNGATFTGYPVVGFNHNMQTSGGCEEDPSATSTPKGAYVIPPENGHLKSTTLEQTIQELETTLEYSGMAMGSVDKLVTCIWNPLKKGLFFDDIAISIPVSKAKDVILDIKKLRDVDNKALCSLGHLGGILIRFQTKSKAYLGEVTNSIMFELLQHRSKEPLTPRSNEDIFEEIEQILVIKSRGKPHWGKNRDIAFEGMHARTLAMEKFLDTRKRYDPLHIFSNELMHAVLELEPSSMPNIQALEDHCALEGHCVCKEDSHCYPKRGYFCRAGHVYKEARVCRRENQNVYS